MDCSIEFVNLFGVQLANQSCQILADDVFEHVGFDFGASFYLVVESLQDFEDELEGFLSDIVDGDLGKNRVTFPFSTARASSTYFMGAACCSVSSYSFPSTKRVAMSLL